MFLFVDYLVIVNTHLGSLLEFDLKKPVTPEDANAYDFALRVSPTVNFQTAELSLLGTARIGKRNSFSRERKNPLGREIHQRGVPRAVPTI